LKRFNFILWNNSKPKNIVGHLVEIIKQEYITVLRSEYKWIGLSSDR